MRMNVVTLEEMIQARLAAAQAATPGPWQHVDFHGGADPGDVTYMGCGSVVTMAHAVLGGDICAPSGDLYPRSGYSPFGDMAFISANGPDVVITNCIEDLYVIARHQVSFETDSDEAWKRYGKCTGCMQQWPCQDIKSVARRYIPPGGHSGLSVTHDS